MIQSPASRPHRPAAFAWAVKPGEGRHVSDTSYVHGMRVSREKARIRPTDTFCITLSRGACGPGQAHGDCHLPFGSDGGPSAKDRMWARSTWVAPCALSGITGTVGESEPAALRRRYERLIGSLAMGAIISKRDRQRRGGRSPLRRPESDLNSKTGLELSFCRAPGFVGV